MTLQLLQTSAVTDPCEHYTELNDASRSTAYEYGNDPGTSDYGLPGGWYRSISEAGGDMPTSPPGEDYCFTNAIWLKGKYVCIFDSPN